MARRASSALSKSVESVGSAFSSLSSMSWVDCFVSVALVFGIVALALFVCNHPDRDSTDTEGFWTTLTTSAERFTNPSPPAVKVVSTNQLEDEVGDDDIGCCLVYYEGCGHCKNYKPTWKRICGDVNGKEVSGKHVKMYECGDDGDQKVWRAVSNRYGIQGYPTILVKIGGRGASWTEYNGPRDKLGEYLKGV